MSTNPHISKILARSGKLPENNDYEAFVDAGERPQLGFSVVHANGDMDGFLYHSLDNLDCRTVNGMEYLTFTHRGKAVTIQGTGLKVGFRNIMRHTLMEIHEQDGRPVIEGKPVITRLKVSMVGEENPDAKALRLVKGS
jgi:hypothetical protein